MHTAHMLKVSSIDWRWTGGHFQKKKKFGFTWRHATKQLLKHLMGFSSEWGWVGRDFAANVPGLFGNRFYGMSRENSVQMVFS
jgi:hypothetical protein